MGSEECGMLVIAEPWNAVAVSHAWLFMLRLCPLDKLASLVFFTARMSVIWMVVKVLDQQMLSLEFAMTHRKLGFFRCISIFLAAPIQPLDSQLIIGNAL